MARIHLFEFEDQKWFPDFLRNYGTDFLQFLSNKSQMYKAIVPVLSNLLIKSKVDQIIDLASGGGGGLISLSNILQADHPHLKILLTDYYPNLPAFKHAKEQANNIDYLPRPVDARQVPKDLKGLRTQFLSFHHFKPEDAKKILQNAVNDKSPIAIFEAQERSVSSLIAMLLSPISVLLATPFIRPFKFGRIIFTYFIPIVPLFVMWDGMVSSLRTYSLKEMKDLIGQLNYGDSFEWEINRVKSGPATILYLTGIPKETVLK